MTNHRNYNRVTDKFQQLSAVTANYPLDVVKQLPNDIENGIYFGWANIDNGDVHKMVMSIGWNPFFDNKEKSMVSWLNIVVL